MAVDFLSELILYRNNPDHVAEVRKAANSGNVDAQYALGLMYAEGRGVDPDPIAAYLWLSRAMQQGDRDAGDLRHIVLQQMTAAQIAEAERQEAGTSWQ